MFGHSSQSVNANLEMESIEGFQYSEHIVKCKWTINSTQDQYLLADPSGNVIGRFKSRMACWDFIGNCTLTADDDQDVRWILRVQDDDASSNVVKMWIDMVGKPEDRNVVLLSVVNCKDWGTPTFLRKRQKFKKVFITTKNKLSCACFPFALTNLTYWEAISISLTYAKIKKNQQFTVPSNDVMAKSIAILLDERLIPDVTIKANGREWKLHKSVLVARSQVFAAMFQSGMKECCQGVVEMNDVDSNSLDLMIKYLYTDKVFESFEIADEAEDLLVLADKYDLRPLKENCEESLASQLTLENCVRLLVFADRVNAGYLRKSAMDKVAFNLSAIIRTAEFEALGRNSFELLIEVTEKALSGRTYSVQAL